MDNILTILIEALVLSLASIPILRVFSHIAVVVGGKNLDPKTEQKLSRDVFIRSSLIVLLILLIGVIAAIAGNAYRA